MIGPHIRRLTARFARGLSSMSMQAESLEVLEKADIPPAQARAFVRAIEIEIAGAKDTLATKHDLLALRSDMRDELAQFRAEVASQFGQLRAEVAEQIGQLRAEVGEQIGQLRAEVGEQIGQLRAEVGEQIGQLRGELHRGISGVVRQMYLAILGQMAVLLGFAYFFATHLR